MRRTHWVAGALGFMSVASGAYTTGCFFSSAEDCTKTLACGASIETGTTTTSTSTGTGTPPGCIPSENSGPVGDGCGVFVELEGDDSGDGSKSSPVKTLKKAIELAKGNGNTVYACAGSFNEVVELPGSVSLFGGLDCKEDWGHGGESKRTVIAPVVAVVPPPAADVIPLKVLGKGDIRIENVDVRAPDAALPGGSSIAVIVENTTAMIRNCTFTAGAAKDGDKGTTPMESVGPSDSDDPLIRGENGAKACTGDATGNPGGATKANTSCNMSIGGAGGVGLEDKGENGLDGAPSGAIGKGGLGQPASGAWSCGTTGNGQAGDDGVSGPSGAGATDLGTIDAAGFAGVDGAPGSPGTPGQAGGGGGGAKGKASCNGASGGGGGAGGCGGAGGLGGQAGGSSIALISLNAKLTFEGVALKAGAGGKGGDGGDGQGGAPGGNGGNGGLGDASAPTTSKACNGGSGGQGGTGGKGGGGRGGHSIGIAFKGASTSKEGVTITIGAPGEGGAGADMTGNGKVGEKAQTFELKN